MTPVEYSANVKALIQKIEFNKRIKCNLVAARYERQLMALKKEYEKFITPSQK